MKNPFFTPHNEAFIDGQNLHINTKSNGWKIDLARFRVYLQEKYKADQAYYFIGSEDEAHHNLYQTIQKAGFNLVFRKHNLKMTGHKKGNVDTDIVFTIMAKIADRENFDQVVLVSGDGDYYKMVEYLIKKKRFGKLLSPNRRSTSSLYRKFTPEHVDFLDKPEIKAKIGIRENNIKNAGPS